MRKKKSKINLQSKHLEDEVNPINAKIVLFVFGIGPLILLGFFLSANGFFD